MTRKPTWAVAFCQGGAELPLTSMLSDKGFTAYCPSARVKPRPNGKRRPLKDCEVIKAAFTNYFFVESLEGEVGLMAAKAAAWRFGSWLDFLKAGEFWTELSDEIVGDLKRREDSGEFNQTYRIFNDKFAMGDRVVVVQKDTRVASNAFAGLDGHVNRCEKYNTWVKFEGFDKPVRIANNALLPFNRNPV